jgi:hypothetical protein
VTMQVFGREHCTMIAAPVQCDVDGIPKGSYYGIENCFHATRARPSSGATSASTSLSHHTGQIEEHFCEPRPLWPPRLNPYENDGPRRFTKNDATWTSRNTSPWRTLTILTSPVFSMK